MKKIEKQLKRVNVGDVTRALNVKSSGRATGTKRTCWLCGLGGSGGTAVTN